MSKDGCPSQGKMGGKGSSGMGKTKGFSARVGKGGSAGFGKGVASPAKAK